MSERAAKRSDEIERLLSGLGVAATEYLILLTENVSCCKECPLAWEENGMTECPVGFEFGEDGCYEQQRFLEILGEVARCDQVVSELLDYTPGEVEP